MKHHPFSQPQVTVGAGIFLQLIYLGHYEQWSVFVPLSCELVFMLYLLGLKLFFEQNLFGLGRGGRKADVGAPKLGEHLLDGVDDSTGGGGAGDRNGPGAEAARQNGGAGVDYERLDGAENGRPTALEVRCMACFGCSGVMAGVMTVGVVMRRVHGGTGVIGVDRCGGAGGCDTVVGGKCFVGRNFGGGCGVAVLSVVEVFAADYVALVDRPEIAPRRKPERIISVRETLQAPSKFFYITLGSSNQRYQASRAIAALHIPLSRSNLRSESSVRSTMSDEM